MTKEALLLALYDIGAIKLGSFKLKSGLVSPIYIDLRLIISYPDILKSIAQHVWELAQPLQFDCLCAVPYTALPITTALSLDHDIPMVMRRREQKDYGTRRTIEGAFTEGQKCLIIEDLVTSGQSIMETILPLSAAGLYCSDVIVFLDRQQGGRASLAEQGYTVHAVTTLTECLEVFVNAGHITHKISDEVQDFLRNNSVSMV